MMRLDSIQASNICLNDAQHIFIFLTVEIRVLLDLHKKDGSLLDIKQFSSTSLKTIAEKALSEVLIRTK